VPGDPELPEVGRTPSFDLTVSATFPDERWGSGGKPSLDDFHEHYYPELAIAVAATWESAQAVPGFEPDVRELAIKPVLGVFPPGKVVFVVDAPSLMGGIVLRLLGIDFDWDGWPPNEGDQR